MTDNKIKGKLGLGCMRLPLIDDKVDIANVNNMVDTFINAGFNYFDTAHGYIGGQSQTAIRDCISSRYPREAFVLADKISYWCFENEEDILPLFEKQLELCGVDYFDYYLFHSMNHTGYEKHIKCNSFEIIQNLKKLGKIKHIGMSFHDTAEFLDKVLTEQPFIEVVQLQINYLDYDDPTVQSKACYDVAVKHGKKVIVMEPVKGGALASLPDEAAEVLKGLGEGSQASHALRYVANYPEVMMVLSGMGNIEMINDNINTFTSLAPIEPEKMKIYDEVREIVRRIKQIPCTKCNYCSDVCPSNVPVSELFFIFNKLLGAKTSYSEIKEELRPYKDRVDSCVKCGRCETTCPQGIKIREYLDKISKTIGD